MSERASGTRRPSNVSAIRRYNSEGHERLDNVAVGVMPRDMTFLEQRRLREEAEERKKKEEEAERRQRYLELRQKAKNMGSGRDTKNDSSVSNTTTTTTTTSTNTTNNETTKQSKEIQEIQEKEEKEEKESASSLSKKTNVKNNSNTKSPSSSSSSKNKSPNNTKNNNNNKNKNNQISPSGKKNVTDSKSKKNNTNINNNNNKTTKTTNKSSSSSSARSSPANKNKNQNKNNKKITKPNSTKSNSIKSNSVKSPPHSNNNNNNKSIKTEKDKDKKNNIDNNKKEKEEQEQEQEQEEKIDDNNDMNNNRKSRASIDETGKNNEEKEEKEENNKNEKRVMNPLGEDPTDSLRKEKVKPWFLSNGITSFAGGSSGSMGTVPSAPRTPHQKKKDYKLLTQQRKSEAVTKEWLTKKQSQRDEEEKVTGEKLIRLEDIQLDWGPMVFDTCLEMLLILDEYWQGRLLIIEEIVNQLCAENMTDDVYYVKMCKLLYALGYQFFDPRSLVINALRDDIGRLAEHNPIRFVPFAPYIMQELYPLFPIRIEVMRESATTLAHRIVNACLDADQAQHDLFYKIMDGLTYKHALTRTVCADFLGTFMKRLSCLETPDALAKNEKFLNDIDISVRRAITAATADTRTNGYHALLIYERIAPTRAKEIISKMSTAVKRKYDRIKRPLSSS